MFCKYIFLNSYQSKANNAPISLSTPFYYLKVGVPNSVMIAGKRFLLKLESTTMEVMFVEGVG